MRLTVERKLQIAFGIVLVFLLLISGIAMYYLNNNNQTLAEIEDNTELIHLYQDISFQTVRANAAIQGICYMARKKCSTIIMKSVIPYIRQLIDFKK